MPSLSRLGMAQQEEEDKQSLEEKFASAVQVIQSLPEEGNDNFNSFCKVVKVVDFVYWSVEFVSIWSINTPGE